MLPSHPGGAPLIALPTLANENRCIETISAVRYPWVALYRRVDIPTLEASVRADLADPEECTLARVIVQDGSGKRQVLAITNRRLVVVGLAGGPGELVQRADDRGALAITLLFDFFKKRTRAFQEQLERAMTIDDATLLARPIHWSSNFRELATSSKAVLLRARSFPWAAGISYPVRSFWDMGSNVGVRFDSDTDYMLLVSAIEPLKGILSEYGITWEKGRKWYQINIPKP
jgi:hypothetical protein